MNNIYYHPDNPYLLYTKIEFDEAIRQRMIECVLSQKDIANYHGGYTFEILDPYCDFAELYGKFLRYSKDIFGPFKFSVKQKNWCWANVYNHQENKTNMHDHQNTSTINSVYYLNVPKDINDQGQLEIYNEGRVDVFYPETGDLVIMPSWMPHKPCDHSSEEYRIAINMEISTIESVDELYTVDKIFLRCVNGRSV
jgi:uncharacterized RmlC-like cupin family protein